MTDLDAVSNDRNKLLMSRRKSENSLSKILKNKPSDQSVQLKRKIENDSAAIIKNIESIDELKEFSVDDMQGIIVELGSNEQAADNLKMARAVISSLFPNVFWSSEYVNPDYTATPSKPKPDFTNQCGFICVNTKENILNTGLYNSNISITFNQLKDSYFIYNRKNKINTILDVVLFTKEAERYIKSNFLNKSSFLNIYPNQNKPYDMEDNEWETNTGDLISKKNNQNIKKPNNKGNKSVIIDIDILAIKTAKGIIAIKERYPFKQHEWVGIGELVDKGYFD